MSELLNADTEGTPPWGCVICGAPCGSPRLCRRHLRLVAFQVAVEMGILNDWELEDDDTLPPLDRVEGVPTHRLLMTKARWGGQCPPWREQLAEWL